MRLIPLQEDDHVGFEFTQHAVSGLNHVSFQTASNSSTSACGIRTDREGVKMRERKEASSPQLQIIFRLLSPCFASSTASTAHAYCI